MKPHALVTNDDGIESAFLHELVDALSDEFQISVAAPAFEQSWIGRAISRRKEIEAIHSPSIFAEGVEAWAINGTPTDCVNIALGNLVKHPVDIVLSGINIGYNISETLILSSGTIAGAIEGAFWGLPAVAFSKSVPNHLFEDIRENKGQTKGDFTHSLTSAAQHAARIALETLKNPPRRNNVVNINFPVKTEASTPSEETIPAKLQLGSIYKPNDSGKYVFHFSEGTEIEETENSDHAALARGSISRSLLDFTQIGKRSLEKT
jgi:5'-nucleotidase